MIKLLIIADDLTGALDTGAQFANRGIKTAVLADGEINFDALDVDAEALSVNARSRHLPRGAAYAAVYAIARKAADYKIPHIYKKTDSTLRGNVGAELQAAADGSGADKIFFVPAYPDNGRTTADGIHYVHGAPLAATHFARDPFNPVRESFVPNILKRQTDMEIKIVRTDAAPDFSRGIHVFDAETNDDLTRIGAILKSAGETALLAGCAGFAAALPPMIGFNARKIEEIVYEKNILLVSGSVNDVSIKQVDTARAHGYRGAVLTPEQKLRPDYAESAGCAAFVNDMQKILRAEKFAYIAAVGDKTDMAECARYAEANGIAPETVHERIVKNIGKIIKKTAGTDLRNLFVFGGDTLQGILDELGVRALRPVAEICPGVVFSKISHDEYNFNLITKSGGLGPENAAAVVADGLSNV